MPRRGTEVVQLPMPSKKKSRIAEEPPPSMDVSFYDDEALPPGIVFSDLRQKKWRIGKPIGRGSFGRIYLASDEVEKEVTKASARYVVKIEPHSNGPLFVEVHCMIRTAEVEKIKSWRDRNKQNRLGMPVYIACGSFTDESTGVRYRFLVLPRYDIDLQKVIARTKVLDLKNVLVLAVQILDVLEYLHDQGYTHSDIKSSNLMLGFDGGKVNKISLPRQTPSFQKETKELTVLSGKHRKPKTTNSRTSNYYDDEDFIVHEKEDSESTHIDQVKKKLRKILSDKESRTMHRHHAFNLRQLSNYVNYEDINSSVCSDQSYQKLLDDFGNKNLIRTSEEFLEHKKKEQSAAVNLNEIFKEAVLSQSNGQIYLLDYGLASKFLYPEGNHKDFGMDARKAHDGTLEYSSRDSHIGAHSRRSDLETLGYNLLDWLTGTLPWKTTEVLAEPDLVHALKKNYMSDIKTFLKTCFKTEFYPQFMEKYLQYVTNLDFTDKPDYDYCRSLFKSELFRNGYNKDMRLNFAEAPILPMGRKLSYSKRFGKKNTPPDFLARNGVTKTNERENVCSLENDLKLELLKQTLNSSSDGIRKPCTSRNFFISDADLVARLKKSLMPHDILGKKLSPKNLRSQKKKIKKRRGVRKHRNSIGKFGNFMGSARQFTWAEILAGNPEDIIRKERNTVVAQNEEEDEDFDENCKFRIRKMSSASEDSDANLQSPLLQKDYLEGKNPTYVMKEYLNKFQKKMSGKSPKETEDVIDGLPGYTYAMMKYFRMKEKRQAKERAELLKQQYLNKEPIIILPRCTRSKKTVKKSESTKNTRQKTTSESSEDEIFEKKLSRSKTSQKALTEGKQEEEKSTKKGKKPASGQYSDSDSDRSSKSSTRKTKQKLPSESEKEKSVLEIDNVSKTRITRGKNLIVEKMDLDVEIVPVNEEKNKSKSTKAVVKKEVKNIKKKPPTTATRCKTSPMQARSAVAIPNNRRRLRSSRRIRQ